MSKSDATKHSNTTVIFLVLRFRSSKTRKASISMFLSMLRQLIEAQHPPAYYDLSLCSFGHGPLSNRTCSACLTTQRKYFFLFAKANIFCSQIAHAWYQIFVPTILSLVGFWETDEPSRKGCPSLRELPLYSDAVDNWGYHAYRGILELQVTKT